MPFKDSSRFRLSSVCYGPIFLPELVESKDDKGRVKIENILVNQSKDLPDMALFKLENQLAAGSDLKMVSTIMVPARTYPADELLEQLNPQQPNPQQTNPQQTDTNKGE